MLRLAGSVTKTAEIGRPKLNVTSSFKTVLIACYITETQPGDMGSNPCKCKKFCCSAQCPDRLWAPSRLRRGSVGGAL
jgi:hypothetical protein